jgi:hypothetical protein
MQDLILTQEVVVHKGARAPADGLNPVDAAAAAKA